ncbi:NAD(P)/FAD-dependent oxidoreductase [Desertibaculum subflavum]|uniref:NAD(P)/FAD-dependent oxidoreductase n=1 Tax=Desertibaculum subflavum TaxID=2268458 RepID=UPI000E666BE9
MQETRVDIAIIGGGIIGAACAWWLTRRGLKVAVVDARQPAAGTSGACDGYVSISSKKPGVVMALAARSKRLYPEVVADLARDVEYRTAGGLLLVEDPATLPELEARAAGVRDFGFDMRFLDRAAMLAREPRLSPALHGAFHCPAEAIVNPYLMTIGMVERAIERGAVALWDAPVTGFERDGDRLRAVETAKCRVVAEQFVLAGGVWSGEVAARLGLEIPIVPRRGELVVTARAPGLARHYLMSATYIVAKANPEAAESSDDPLMRLGHGFCLEPNALGQYILGSTRSFAGFDRRVTAEGIRAIVTEAVRRLPALAKVPVLRTFAGLRPYMPDKKPVIGRSARVPNLIVATGHEGDGICLSVVTGELVADLVQARAPAVAIDELTPDRFGAALASAA